MSLKIGDEISSIFYASEKHRNETHLALSYEDMGVLIISEKGLEFSGDTINLKIQNIRSIAQVESQSRELGDWIQICYKDIEGTEKIANFIRLEDEVLMGKKKENTTDLFNELSSFNK